MDDDLPSGAEILAMRHPSEIFGASLGDARALRKHWARIARAFRDTEPAVFQHARELFECARDGVDRVVPVAAMPTTPELADVQQMLETPEIPVREWLDDGDHLSLASLLEHDPGAILQHAPLHEVLLAVVLGGGPDLTPAQMAAVERELAHDRLMISPVEEAAIVGALSEARMIQRLREDSRVAESFVALVMCTRLDDVVPTVHAMDTLLSELSGAALDSLLRVVCTSHPLALAVVVRRMRMFERECAEPDLGYREVDALHDAYRQRQEWSVPLLLGGAAVWAFCSFIASRIAMIAWFGGPQFLTNDAETIPMIVGVVVGFVVLFVGYFVGERRKKSASTAHARAVLAVARQFGLFPGEAVRVLVSQSRAELPVNHSYKPRATVVAIEADPASVFYCWGTALSSRLLALSSKAPS